MVNLFRNSWRVSKPTGTKRWSMFSCRAATWLMHILAAWWVLSKRWVLKHFFFLSTCDEYRVWHILRLTSAEVWLFGGGPALRAGEKWWTELATLLSSWGYTWYGVCVCVCVFAGGGGRNKQLNKQTKQFLITARTRKEIKNRIMTSYHSTEVISILFKNIWVLALKKNQCVL